MNREHTIRLGFLRVSLAGVGCLGMILFVLVIYLVSALFWGFIFMLIHGAVVHAGMGPGYWTTPWGFSHSVIPWGLIAPFILG